MLSGRTGVTQTFPFRGVSRDIIRDYRPDEVHAMIFYLGSKPIAGRRHPARKPTPCFRSIPPRFIRIAPAPDLRSCCLHGIGLTRHMWEAVAALADRFTLVSYDLPGHGETDPPDHAYEIDDLSEQLAAVLTASGIARAHLVGSSLGGMVAQHFAATWPERVDRLVLCDTSPALSEGMRDAFLTMRDHVLRPWRDGAR